MRADKLSAEERDARVARRVVLYASLTHLDPSEAAEAIERLEHDSREVLARLDALEKRQAAQESVGQEGPAKDGGAALDAPVPPAASGPVVTSGGAADEGGELAVWLERMIEIREWMTCGPANERKLRRVIDLLRSPSSGGGMTEAEATCLLMDFVEAHANAIKHAETAGDAADRAYVAAKAPILSALTRGVSAQPDERAIAWSDLMASIPIKRASVLLERLAFAEWISDCQPAREEVTALRERAEKAEAKADAWIQSHADQVTALREAEARIRELEAERDNAALLGQSYLDELNALRSVAPSQPAPSEEVVERVARWLSASGLYFHRIGSRACARRLLSECSIGALPAPERDQQEAERVAVKLTTLRDYGRTGLPPQADTDLLSDAIRLLRSRPAAQAETVEQGPLGYITPASLAMIRDGTSKDYHPLVRKERDPHNTVPLYIDGTKDSGQLPSAANGAEGERP